MAVKAFDLAERFQTPVFVLSDLDIGMGDGFHVGVRIAIWEDEDVRRVPMAALFHVGEQWAVFVVQNGRAHQTIVDIGVHTATDAEVRNGLRAGQQVVLSPPDTLADNARVAVRDE